MEKTTTTRYSLGFRLLARVEGRRWLSKIKRNTTNAAATHHSSASTKQPAPQTSIPQSQLNSDTPFNLPTKEQTTMVMDAVMFQSTKKDEQGTHNTQSIVGNDNTHPIEIEEQEQEGNSGEKVKNINEKDSGNRNHIQEEMKDVGQQNKRKRGRKCTNKKRGAIESELSKSSNKEKECLIESELRKDQRREILLARLRARIEKSEARFKHFEEQNNP